MCLARPLEVVVARCFAFVGEYLQLDNRFAIGNFILDCLHNRPVEIKGDGTPRRSYMHGADLVEWLLTILAQGTAGEIYNVGSDRDLSIEEVAGAVKRIVGSDNEIVVQIPADGTRPASRYVPSITKVVKELDLTVKIGLDDAIKATVADWKARENVT